MKVLNSLHIRTKFVVIIMSLLVPLAVLLYLLVAEKNIAIRFARQEMVGSAYLETLHRLLSAIPAQALGTMSPADKKQQLAAIRADLAVAEKSAGADLKTAEKFAELNGALGTLCLTPDQSQAAATVFQKTQALVSRVGDTSNLILDPDLDSYYVMDAVLLKIPSIEDIILQLVILGEQALEKGPPTADQRTQFVVLLGQLRLTSSELKRGISVAFANNAGGTVKAHLDQPLTETMAELDRILDMIEKDIIGGRSEQVSLPAYLSTLSGGLTSAASLWTKGNAELAFLLKSRINGFERNKYFTISWVTGIALLSILIALLIIRNLSCRLSAVVASLRAVAEGNLAVTLQDAASDELGEVAGAVNKTVAALRGLVQLLVDAAQHVSTVVATVEEGARTTVNALGSQAVEAGEAATAIEEMSQTIDGIAQGASDAATLSRETVASAAGGRTASIESMKAVRNIHEKTAGLADMIEKLNSRTSEIGDIVTVIEDIADQTNLLALNAAIEAARAGESGRGFAVVADEVRSLAEKTVQATARISDTINGVQRDAARTVATMEEAAHEVSAAVDRMTVLEHEFSTIDEKMKEVDDKVCHIATAVNQQSTVSLELAKNIERTSDGAHRVEIISRDVLDAVAMIRKTADELVSTASRFRMA